MREMRRELNNLRLEPKYTPTYSPYASTAAEYTVHATRTTHGFKQSEENLSGADILLGFSADLSDNAIDKTALVQAKLFKELGEFRNFPKSREERNRLLRQCKRMMHITPHAYVFVYSSLGIQFFPAQDIVTAFDTGVDFAQGLSFEEFIERLFICEIGDHGYQTVHRADFRRELRRLGIQNGFTVEVLPS